MKLKYRIVLFIFVGGILAFSALYMLNSREPAHQGRPLTEWLADLDRHVSPSQSRKAEEAIRCIGTNALPQLLRMLQTRDSAWKRKLIELERKQSVIKLHFTTENQRHSRALAGFKTLGADAQPAVPVLIGWLENRGGPQLDSRTRMAAIATLRELGPPAKSAIPALIEALKENDARVQAYAAFALGAIGQEPSMVVPALAARLNDPDPVVRGNSVGALSKFGERAKAAVPALERALYDTNGNVRSLARIALRKIDPEGEAGPQEWRTLLNARPE